MLHLQENNFYLGNLKPANHTFKIISLKKKKK